MSRVPEVSPLQVEGVGRRILSGFLFNTLAFRRENLHAKGVRHVLCDVALDLEDVVQVPVIVLRPEVPILRHIYELGSDPDPVPCFLESSLKYGPHLELPSDFPDLLRRTLVAYNGSS